MYLYVTTDDGACEAALAASAVSCFFSPSNNRPVMANINFCSMALTTYTPERLLSTAVHELIHSLGFTNLMFGLYINQAGSTLGLSSIISNGSPGVTSSSAARYRSGQNVVFTPNVRTEVTSVLY